MAELYLAALLSGSGSGFVQAESWLTETLEQKEWTTLLPVSRNVLYQYIEHLYTYTKCLTVR